MATTDTEVVESTEPQISTTPYAHTHEPRPYANEADPGPALARTHLPPVHLKQRARATDSVSIARSPRHPWSVVPAVRSCFVSLLVLLAHRFLQRGSTHCSNTNENVSTSDHIFVNCRLLDRRTIERIAIATVLAWVDVSLLSMRSWMSAEKTREDIGH